MFKHDIYMGLGYVGAFLLTIRLIPQIIHTYKTKKVDDIHRLYLILDFLLSISMLTYSIGIFSISQNDYTMLPVIVGNVSATTCSIIMIGFKYIYSQPLSYITIIDSPVVDFQKEVHS